MSTHSQSKNIGRKAEKVTAAVIDNIDEIKGDFEALKSNAVGLANNLRDVGTEQARLATDYVLDRMDELKNTGTETLGKVEEKIKSNPSQSIAIAFTVGALTSYLLGRRSM